MRNKLILIFTLIIISIKGQNQFQWAESIGGTTNDGGTSIAIDINGNVYTTGSFYGIVDFDPGPGTFTLNSIGNSDIFLLKLDSAGNFLYAKSIGSIANDVGNAITTDLFGNVYLTGMFSNIADFDPNAGIYNLNPAGGLLTFIMKLDPLGNLIWAENVGGVLGGGSDIELDFSGNLYITGIYSGTADFDPGPSIFNLVGGSLSSVFILKLTNFGNLVFAKTFTSSIQIQSTGIGIDNSGNVITTGHFRGTADFDPSPATFSFTAIAFEDVFLTKLDPNGNLIWAKTIGGSFNELSTGLDLDNAGNIYTTGSFAGTVDFDPNVGVFNLNANGNVDIYILKINAFGNFVWAKGMGGALTDMSNAITLDSFVNIIITGGFSGIADFDPNLSNFFLTSDPGSYDVFISQIDSSGNFLQAKKLGGTANDNGNSVATNSISNIYTTGYFGDTPDFDPDLGTYTLTAIGGSDIFIHKLNLCIFDASITSNNVLCNGNNNGSATVSINGIGPFTYTWNPISSNTSTISGLSPGIYTCTISNGCNNITTKTVVIQPSLVVTAAANNSIVCAGSASTLTAIASGGNGIITYSWVGGPASNSFVVNPIINTTYTVIATDSYSCQKSYSVNISVLSSPSITINSGSICNGNSFTIVPSGANTYTFSSGSAVVSPSFTSTYSIVGTSSAGCISNSAAISTITVNPLPIITVNSGSICSGDSFTMVPSGATTYTIQGGSAVVSPSVNTNYSVTGTSANGCIASTFAISNVIVNPTPTITINSGSICVGDSFIIIPNGANTYTYSGGSAIVSPTLNTFYTVIGTSTAGCSSATPAICNVSVNPLPIINVTTNDTLICSGETVTLTANGAVTYSWSSGGSTNTEVDTPTLTTTYSVTGTDVNGCQNVAIYTQSVDPCAGVKEIYKSEINLITIFPNPSDGNFFIETHEPSLIVITDVLGKIIIQQKIETVNSKTLFTTFSKGVYIVRINNSINNKAVKLIIE